MPIHVQTPEGKVLTWIEQQEVLLRAKHKSLFVDAIMAGSPFNYQPVTVSHPKISLGTSKEFAEAMLPLTTDGYEMDEHWCGHCEKTTMHKCKYDNHERDSSGDYFVCLECKWEYFGFTGEHSEPTEQICDHPSMDRNGNCRQCGEDIAD